LEGDDDGILVLALEGEEVILDLEEDLEAIFGLVMEELLVILVLTRVGVTVDVVESFGLEIEVPILVLVGVVEGEDIPKPILVLEDEGVGVLGLIVDLEVVLIEETFGGVPILLELEVLEDNLEEEDVKEVFDLVLVVAGMADFILLTEVVFGLEIE